MRRLETLKKHLPFSGPEGINELKRIAVRFEEKVFSSSVHQVIIHTSSSIFVSLVLFYKEICEGNAHGKKKIRSFCSPIIRWCIESHVYLIFLIISNFQTDYLRKISLKMLIMETKDQNTAGSSSSIPADSNNPALDELGKQRPSCT